MNNFHYVSVLLDMLYGLEIENEDMEELGLLAWEHIGNKRTKLYRYRDCIGSDLSVKLPCNFSSLEAVTSIYEDARIVTNHTDSTDLNNSYLENFIEAEKYFTSPYYVPGKLLKYERVGDTLYFSHNYGTVNILYNGILVDEDGLPEITDKEAQAIATYIAYIYKYKEGLRTNNPQIIQMSETLYLKWSKLCDLARVTDLSLNDMNEILDIKNTWDRTNYGLSFKYRK